MNYATIHIVHFSIKDIIPNSNYKTFNQYYLDANKEKEAEAFKNLTKYLLSTNQLNDVKRGDLIENANESGYRSDGVYMVDIADDQIQIVGLEHEFDEYGSPNNRFTFPEFHSDYWNYDHMQKKDGVPKSQWHFDPLPIRFRFDAEIKYYKVKGINEPTYATAGPYFILLDLDDDELERLKSITDLTAEEINIRDYKRTEPRQTITYFDNSQETSFTVSNPHFTMTPNYQFPASLPSNITFPAPGSVPKFTTMTTVYAYPKDYLVKYIMPLNNDNLKGLINYAIVLGFRRENILTCSYLG